MQGTWRPAKTYPTNAYDQSYKRNFYNNPKKIISKEKTKKAMDQKRSNLRKKKSSKIISIFLN